METKELTRTYRFKINKKVGLNTYIIRYGAGCQCSFLELQLRVPLEADPDEYIRKVVYLIENADKIVI